MKKIVLIVFSTLALTLPAITVTDVSAHQRWPWNNLIDIDFSIGDASDDATFKIDVKAAYAGGDRVIVAKTFVTEPIAKAGANRVTWDFGTDFPNFKADDLRVAVTAMPFANGTDGVWMIIDLSGGKDAAKYPVRYTTTAPEIVPTNNYALCSADPCRTTQMWLKRIKGGSFMFCQGDSSPGEFKVNVTKDFYMGIFECTQRQWAQVAGSWPSKFTNPDFRDVRPCESIGHTELMGHFQWPRNTTPTAGSFVGKMRARTGLATFSLPTEAQWEWANRCGARNGKHSCYVFSQIRYGMPDSNVDFGCDLSNGTIFVGTYIPNVWGLYEMFGNVAEWCLDAYVGDSVLRKYYGALQGLSQEDSTYSNVVVENPIGPPLANTYDVGSPYKQYESSYESYHVLRGAAWYNSSGHLTHFKRYQSDNLAAHCKGVRFVVTCD